jgi:hypothetical protein
MAAALQSSRVLNFPTSWDVTPTGMTELPDERTPITVMSAYIAKPPFCQQLANNNVTNKLAWINERSRLRHARCR